MEQNKTGRYLKYAVGEIFLVVIGILIALQINNWNELRKRDQLRLTYLNNLKTEFTYNLEEIDRAMRSTENNMNNAKLLSTYTGDKAENLDEETCGKLMGLSIMAELQLRPSTGALTEILNAGDLGLFHNEELKQLLASWDGALMKVRSQEQEHLVFRNKMIELVSAQGNWRDFMDTYLGPKYDVRPSNLNAKNLPILQSSEFENYLVTTYVTAKILKERYYYELRERIVKTLEIINNEIVSSI